MGAATRALGAGATASAAASAAAARMRASTAGTMGFGALGAGADGAGEGWAIRGVTQGSQGIASPVAVEDEEFVEVAVGGEKVSGLLFSGVAAGVVGACAIR